MSAIEENLNNCAFCLKPSKYKCERCYEWYCSKECQDNDWYTHKFNCFTMPNLIEVHSEIFVETFGEENNTEIVDYIVEDNTQFNLNAKVQKVQQLSNTSDEEQTVEDENNNSNMFEFNHENEGSGNEDEIHNQQSFLTIVDSSQKEEYDDKEISTEKSFRQICDDEEEYVTAEDSEPIDILETKPKIEEKAKPLVLPKQQKENLVDQINETDKDKFGLVAAKSRIKNRPGPYQMKDIIYHKWPKTKNIRIKILSTIQPPNIMSFCENKPIINEFYEYLQQEIDLHVKNLKRINYHYLPKTNEIVIGKYKEKWYRACVIDPEEYGIIVQFIDCGILHVLKTNEVLPITEDLLFEVCARDFVVDNIPDELDEKQQEILNSREMMITNIYKDKRGIFHCNIFGF
ncbi:hypothetical protein PVAND_007339 [Polypedilum vanderplanki]|uniref:MYND-type domain-containing protein n=1 Tax=Polypedilum vanderplanki TaxID=319348 RepID=A0A9J6C7I4_POLVA|nr:hypothetical protein PVAND_007339 [Polypedilum vanderplanki]